MKKFLANKKVLMALLAIIAVALSQFAGIDLSALLP